MHITRIELENIKSHKLFKCDFQRGTTAIMGENGAGKTTIIEAIAWTLFDLLDYKKQDFVRRGAKKGSANVTFESGLDERHYSVFRDTGTSYYVYDLKLKTRIAEKKEEVQRFLWQHLGVESGTDLEALFRNAIGVPQGTFTADFLKSPSVRKPIFDKLLKVEEYRQGADKLLDTANFIKNKENEISNKISFAKGKLEGFEEADAEYKTLAISTKDLTKTFTSTEKLLSSKKNVLEDYEKIEVLVNDLKLKREKIENEKSRLEVVLSQKEKEKGEAEKASEEIKLVEKDHSIYLDAVGKLKEFERERTERDKLNAEIAKVEAAIVNVKADQKSADDERKKIAEAHEEIVKLKPKLDEQAKLEKRRDELNKSLAKADEIEKNIGNLERKLTALRIQHTENKKQTDDASKNKKLVETLAESVKREDVLKNELAGLKAKLETDRKFKSELENGFCPILSAECLNLAKGESPQKQIADRFDNLEKQIKSLEKEQTSVAKNVVAFRNAEKAAAGLETLEKRQNEITEEGKSLRDEQDILKRSLEDLPELKKELVRVEDELETLGSPREKIKLLEKETQREISIREKITSIASNFERLESERRLKVEQLDVYKDLDSNWKEYTEKRDKTSNAHKVFLANENMAKTRETKSKEFESTRSQLKELDAKIREAKKNFKKENSKYDLEKHQNEKLEFQTLERKFVEVKTNLDHSQKRESELKEKIRKLKAIKFSMADDENKLARFKKMGEATAFIRSTLKEAAPRVAKNYVYHVSIEANTMFRDISGNAERTLRWTEDYGIVLEEDGYERPFQNLSGGEQMAAALSVRLALLKQLSDIRLAFFDEPTTNMDAERRERLAEQISSITENQTFDQLFVVSHDDTFENYVDNVLTVRTDGE